MDYTLYGSQTSPFVRRLRLQMEHIPYTYKEVNVFGAEDAKVLNRINPLNQIPVLLSGDQAIWDSRQIFNYLNHMHRLQNLDWDDENRLTAIEGAISSAVTLLLMKRSGIDVGADLMFVQRQRDRIESVLDHLKPFIEQSGETWDFHIMSLYCFFDWALFRGIISLEQRPECRRLLELHQNREIVLKTTLPKA
jgi:glutathione S-transferase